MKRQQEKVTYNDRRCAEHIGTGANEVVFLIRPAEVLDMENIHASTPSCAMTVAATWQTNIGRCGTFI